MQPWRTAALAAFALSSLLCPLDRLMAQDSTRATRPPAATPPAPPPAPRTAPILEPDVPAEPLPPGSRYTFTRDSVLWSSAVSLADLLAVVPGVYVTRAGFLGQPGYVVYGGRGAATLEVYRDGIQAIPLGGDSVFIDPSRIPLANLQRIDVEVLPAQLRVYLTSERHETIDTRSVVGVMSGDFATAEYTGLFQKRWRGGFGLNLGADFFASNGAPLSTRTDQSFEAWGRVEWMPSPKAGAVYQIRRQNDDHDALAALSAPGVPPRRGSRTDASLRLFAAAATDRRGLSGTLDLGSQSWTDDSTVSDRTIRFVIGRARYATPRGAVEVTGRASDGVQRQSVEARAGWVLVPGVSISGDARATTYLAGRSGQRAHGAVAFYRGPFSLVGEANYSVEPQAPSLRADSARRTVDRAARFAFSTRPFTAGAGIVRRGAYDPLPFTDLPALPATTVVPRSTYYTSEFWFRPIRPLTLEGWYVHPVIGGADFQPPHHARAAFTFRSKFWRTFRSGAFDLKVQIAVESWSQGIAGRTSSGAPIALNGLTFTETYLAFQIVGFTAFWDLRNAWNTRDSYVPGFQPYPRNAQTFGVKWEFRN